MAGRGYQDQQARPDPAALLLNRPPLTEDLAPAS
jgi:hypothetical protein